MTPAEAVRPMLKAVVSTATSLLAFAVLRAGGAGTEASLISGLILAGILNIRDMWSLTDDQPLPTSEQVLGS